MAEVVFATIAAAVIPNISQGVKALKDSSRNLRDAPSNLKRLDILVKQVEDSIAEARRIHSSKLHNDRFRDRLQSLYDLVQGFRQEADRAAVVTSKTKVTWLLCCWNAMVGDQLLQLAYSMESRLHTWLEDDKISQNISEVLDRYTQGLPSYLSLQPEDGYQPLESKVDAIYDLLENSSRKVVLVHGLSGMGKSSLAHYVASSCLPERFSDGSTKLWIGYGCSRQGTGNNQEEYYKVLADKIVHLLRTQLGYKKHDIGGMDLESALSILEKTLEGKKYLLIIDDVWEQDILNRFLRLRDNECKYLITSRAVFSGSIDKVELCKEDVAPVGKKILEYHSQVPELPEIADVLLERCGCHPFTVAVMAQALEGETRAEQWAQAIHELRIYASQARVPGQEGFSAATVFGSLEFSLKAMEKNARDLFTSFAALSWVEPVPEACLEELWKSLGHYGTFRLEIGALLRASLVGKHKSSYSYVVHDMVAFYLEDKQEEALKLLRFPGSSPAVVAWLHRYGSFEFKRQANSALMQVMNSRDEHLQARVFEEIVNVCSACRKYQDWVDTSASFVQLLLPDIPKLLSELPVGGKAAAAVIRFITLYYTSSDWENNMKSLQGSKLVIHLRPLLFPDNESLKSVVDMVQKLAIFRLGNLNQQEQLETLEDIPMTELIQLLDPQFPDTRNFVGGSVIKALLCIAKAGKQAAVEKMFKAGLGDAMVKQVMSDFQEFSGDGMRELYLLREYYADGGSLILDAFLESKVLAGTRYIEYFQRSLITY